jgi:hypothetical protein
MDPGPPPPPPVGPGKTASELELNPPKAAEPNLLGGYDALTKFYGERKAGLAERRAELGAKRESLEQQAITLSEQEEAAKKPILGSMKEWAEAPLPTVPGAMQEPEQPDLSPRPFLEGPRKGGTVQQLNAVLQGLGMLATMAGGLSRGYAQGALTYYSSALTGWAEGDAIRADRDYRGYLLNLDRAKRDYQHRWDTYEGLVKQHGMKGSQLQTQLLIAGAEFGEPRRRLELMSTNVTAALQDLKTEGEELDKLADHTRKIQDGMFQRYIDREKLGVERGKLAVERAKEDRRAAWDKALGRFLGVSEAPGVPSGAPGGGVLGGPAGGVQWDPKVSIGPSGPTISFEQRKLGEEAKKSLKTYDTIIAAVNDFTNYTDAEIDAYSGLWNRGFRDIKQAVGSIPGLQGLGLTDDRYARFRALTGRTMGSAFGEGGKQLTPFEANVVFSYTPTGSEPGGPTEFRAKLEQLGKYTRLRRDLTAYYEQRGMDPTLVPAQLWDAQIQEGLKREGVLLPAPRPRGPGGAPGAQPGPGGWTIEVEPR